MVMDAHDKEDRTADEKNGQPPIYRTWLWCRVYLPAHLYHHRRRRMQRRARVSGRRRGRRRRRSNCNLVPPTESPGPTDRLPHSDTRIQVTPLFHVRDNAGVVTAIEIDGEPPTNYVQPRRFPRGRATSVTRCRPPTDRRFDLHLHAGHSPATASTVKDSPRTGTYQLTPCVLLLPHEERQC